MLFSSNEGWIIFYWLWFCGAYKSAAGSHYLHIFDTQQHYICCHKNDVIACVHLFACPKSLMCDWLSLGCLWLASQSYHEWTLTVGTQQGATEHTCIYFWLADMLLALTDSDISRTGRWKRPMATVARAFIQLETRNPQWVEMNSS